MKEMLIRIGLYPIQLVFRFIYWRDRKFREKHGYPIEGEGAP